ncbi:MAG: ABC transporter ATP-binding protein [Gaiellales bacterium]
MGTTTSLDRPVEARGLVKRYGDLIAVDHVDLSVDAGDVYGYLGPNGAGKTTSLRMLLGLIRPTEGGVRLFGRDPQTDGRRALERVAGFVEAPRFYPYLTGRKNLELCAAFDGGHANRLIGQVLDIVELTDRAGDRVGNYSHGMKQRLGIAASLLREPRLLILDEPNTGLDPAGMRDMKLLIRQLSSDGITVLLSSHQMADVEELCNKVAIINRGRVLYEGDVTSLKHTLGTWYRLRASRLDQAHDLVRQFELADLEREDDEIHFSAPEEVVERFVVALGQHGIGIHALVPQQATLEQLFFQLTESDGVAEPAEVPALREAV